MARVPISFYLNVIAGMFVVFHHYTSFETGDTALSKVSGAADRFYTLLRNTTLKFQDGYASRLQSTACGSAMDSIIPRDVAEYVRLRYCHIFAQDPDRVDEGPNGRRHHGGYGSSDFAFAHYQLSSPPFVSRTSTKGLQKQLPPSLHESSRSRLSKAVWDQSSEVAAAIGLLLARTCASWWWFRAPLKVAGMFFATYAVLSALGCVFTTSMLLRLVSQAYMVVAADFLWCIEWEAQRRIPDIAIVMAERAYGPFKYSQTQIEE